MPRGPYGGCVVGEKPPAPPPTPVLAIDGDVAGLVSPPGEYSVPSGLVGCTIEEAIRERVRSDSTEMETYDRHRLHLHCRPDCLDYRITIKEN